MSATTKSAIWDGGTGQIEIKAMNHFPNQSEESKVLENW
jgi:hypothetical protein